MTGRRCRVLLLIAIAVAVLLVAVGQYRRNFYRVYNLRQAMYVLGQACIQYVRINDVPPACAQDLLASGVLTKDAAGEFIRCEVGMFHADALGRMHLQLPTDIREYKCVNGQVVDISDITPATKR